MATVSRRNQYLGLPPDDEIQVWVEYYWCLGLSDKKIASFLKTRYNTDMYSCRQLYHSERSVRRLRQKYGLQSTRKQAHTTESIAEAAQEIRQRFPTMGARAMVTTLRQDYGIRVPEQLVALYLRLTEPLAVQGRKGRHFIRKLFYSAGVNDVWAFDQHDKWKRFGLYLHVGLDPYSGRCLWLRIWWTNRNPRLVTSFYLDSAKKEGGVPLVTQSDPGTENYGIANCHTTIRQQLDASLEGTLQHRWMRNKSNVKPEIMWSVLRRTWTPGFENLLDEGLYHGLYDPGNVLEKLVFLWLVVPWLQDELDLFVRRFNSSPRRADKHKLTPQGILDLIATQPEQFDALDFKVIVAPETFFDAERNWANPDDPVFQLTPPLFDSLAADTFARLGLTRAMVNVDTFWDCYLHLRAALLALAEIPDLSDAPQSQHRLEEQIQAASRGEVIVPLLPNLRPLRHGEEIPGPDDILYMGGLDNAPSPRVGARLSSEGVLSESEGDSDDAGLGPRDNMQHGLRARFTPPPNV